MACYSSDPFFHTVPKRDIFRKRRGVLLSQNVSKTSFLIKAKSTTIKVGKCQASSRFTTLKKLNYFSTMVQGLF